VAFVVPERTDPGYVKLLQTHLTELCTNILARHKIPSEIHIVRSLPTGPTGKVRKQMIEPSTLELLA